MLVVLFSFLSLKLLAQTASLSQALLAQSSYTQECVLELDLETAEQVFFGLSSELQEQFLALAHLRVSLDQNREMAESRSELFLIKRKELSDLILEKKVTGQFDLFFKFALHLARIKKNGMEVKKTQKKKEVLNSLAILELQDHFKQFKAKGKTIKALYEESFVLFSEHRKKGYFKTDLGLSFLDDAFGLAYSTQLKELIRKIINAEDLSDEKAFALLKEIKPKFKFGEVRQILEFEALLKASSLEEWAKETLPRLFIDMNRAPTRLGQKISWLLWSEKKPINNEEDKTFREFVIQAVMTEDSDRFWTTKSIVRAFREILEEAKLMQLSATLPATLEDVPKEAIKAWLSRSTVDPASIQAKARYLGLMLNQPDYENWITLLPEPERQRVEKAIDEFTILRLIRVGLKNEVEQKRFMKFRKRFLWAIPKSVFLLENLPKAVLEAFEFIEAPIPEQGVSYTMGSPREEYGRSLNEREVNVTLKQPFQFGATKVTQWLYKMMMTHWLREPRFDRSTFTYNQAKSRISFNEAKEFVNRLTKLLKKIDPNHPCRYELSTEARWEFMAKAGTNTAYSFGNDSEDLFDFGFFDQNSNSQAQAVTAKLPNGFGVFGVHGDVWERQQDGYVEPLPGGVDPVVPIISDKLVIRAGARFYNSWFTRSSSRNYGFDHNFEAYLGLRLVRICR